MTHTLTDRESLLRSVLANPADDAPRLIYADWLEENGKVSHAGFIRSQIAGEARCPPLTVVADVEWVFGKEAHTLTREGVLGSASVYASISRDVPILVYRRGFVCSVHCTERQLMGGECERCNGRNSATYFRGRPCPNCHGTGNIIGIGSRLVGEHPIERVVVTDKRPLVMPGWVLPYRWLRDDGTGSPSMLGDSIFDLVDDSKDNRRSFNWGKCFNTEQAARDAHSAACIEWAKRQGERCAS